MKRFAFVLSLTVACAFGGVPGEAAAQDAADAVPCTVPVERGGDVAWKQVEGDGFTFCVPAKWREGSAGTVRGGGGTITWALGEYRPDRVVIMRRPVGTPLPSQFMGSTSRTYNEVIGDRPAELWIGQTDGKHHTRAVWSAPGAMHMRGEAPSLAVAELQLEVYRTVRFPTP